MRTGGEIGLCKSGALCYNSSCIGLVRLFEKEGFRMNFTYRPKGVCSQLMELDIEDGRVKSFSVLGGCDGNLQGIARLVEGMEVEEVIRRLDGIRCGGKPTSCPDQLARALKAAREAAQV